MISDSFLLTVVYLAPVEGLGSPSPGGSVLFEVYISSNIYFITHKQVVLWQNDTSLAIVLIKRGNIFVIFPNLGYVFSQIFHSVGYVFHEISI